MHSFVLGVLLIIVIREIEQQSPVRRWQSVLREAHNEGRQALIRRYDDGREDGWEDGRNEGWDSE